jgi:hypothetical protein
MTLGGLAIEPIQNRLNAFLERGKGPKASAESQVPRRQRNSRDSRFVGARQPVGLLRRPAATQAAAPLMDPSAVQPPSYGDASAEF